MLPPEYIPLPVSISTRIRPKDQMSVRLSTTFPRACSGLMYAAVPSTIPSCVASIVSVGDLASSASDSSVSSALARPKSNTLTVPSGVIFTFDGFTSR